MATATFDDLARALGHGDGEARSELPPAEVVLDVRMTNEWHNSHIEGAVHIPLYEVNDRITEIPTGAVWVHCGSGYRAATAASLLDRAGRTVVLIDDMFGHASEAGIPLSS